MQMHDVIKKRVADDTAGLRLHLLKIEGSEARPVRGTGRMVLAEGEGSACWTLSLGFAPRNGAEWLLVGCPVPGSQGTQQVEEVRTH